MKITELKIGNFVMILGKVREIEGLFNLPQRKDMYWVKCKDFLETKIIHFKGVPLTEEWLINFGFEMYEFDNKANQFRFKDRLIVYREGFLYDYGLSVKLEFVHQLQNIYSAIIGEELKIQL